MPLPRTICMAVVAPALFLLPTLAMAKVVLPDGTAIPTPDVLCQGGEPGGLKAIFACACTEPDVCNIGAPCPGGTPSCDLGENGTCEATIWHELNDNSCIPSNHKGLDPMEDAAVSNPFVATPSPCSPAAGRCSRTPLVGTT
ncbi:MAG: hypothetical protein JRH20_10255 [Deltaproteobacteria bacterium]|nr:hypothetical protein [Deltaproteobacteria bacterium]